jgi:hypothetical protein
MAALAAHVRYSPAAMGCITANLAAFAAAVRLQPAQPITPIVAKTLYGNPHCCNRLPLSAHHATIVTLQQRSVILLQPNAT